MIREICHEEEGTSLKQRELGRVGQLSLTVRSKTTYLTLCLKKSYLLNLNDSRYFIKTCATQGN